MPTKSKVILSSEKYKELKKELETLTTKGRKEIADKLDLYRGESEEEDSIPYSDLLQEKQVMEQRIEDIENMLENAEIKDSCDTQGRASLGCRVTIKKGRQKKEFQLVSPIESDPMSGKLSSDSPLGQALIGKKKGEVVNVKTPSGSEKWTIEKVG